MPIIKVVGAGFSGLTTAYFLVKRGFKVKIVEKSSRAGGLIETIQTEHGLIEKAANGILNSAKLEAIAADIGVPLQSTRREGRKRFIFRGRPRQLPLRTSEVLKVGARVAANATNLKPRPLESIAEWGQRVAGTEATDYLLTPALGGIYAGDPGRLSASLIFGKATLPDHLRTNRPAKGKKHGTIAPPRGMQQLMDSLRNWLEQAGVEFVFNYDDRAHENGPVVVCLAANAAADYLTDIAPEVSQPLRRIEMLSLVTVSSFYGSDAAKLNGFGCLFPRDQGFRARGVLFNNCIFEGRGPANSETWIFGGALDPDVINLTDEEFGELIAGERERFYGQNDKPLSLYVNRRPQAIPHYSIELEKILTTLPAPPPNVALVGNYLGRIGLAKLIERAAVVAEDLSSALRGSSPTVREGRIGWAGQSAHRQGGLMSQVGVLLINLGTPDAPTPKAVGRYLREFLMDGFVIDIPAPLRWFLVNVMIVPRRKYQSAHAYQKVQLPEGSPLLVHTRALAKEVATRLNSSGDAYFVGYAMRYGNPSIKSALATLKSSAVSRIIVLPLYPQYAESSFETAVVETRRSARQLGCEDRLTFLPPFYDRPEFINAWAELIRESVDAQTTDHIIFSFHGVPVSHLVRLHAKENHCMTTAECCVEITSSNENCYRAQCSATARAIASHLELNPNDYTVSFQSRLGRAEWISPNTVDVLHDLANRGIKRIAVACPSFVADCLETLEEIGIRGRETFMAAGGQELQLIPSLNCHGAWVDTIVAWIRPRAR